MLKVLAYIEDLGEFRIIAASESGRLATRTQNPYAAIPEIQDFERFLKARLDANLPNTKTEGLAELIEEVHQYNETVATYERVRYIKTLTPQLAQMIHHSRVQFDALSNIRGQQNQATIIDMQLTVVKVEKDEQ